ncbi:unnamed protein product [Ceutorhynchus assimilis]|uniref:Kinesin motor domain-containing protein n=1 Tax=Ceutorhynchus assimilis TaxID=467358 RepID=A0A9N9MU75_9CUCU|nr:unnamed protein product [Ceutorhynchus assimilis]
MTEENMSNHADLCRQKRIFFRVYPSEFVDSEYIKLDIPNNKIYIRHLEELSTKYKSKKLNYWEFCNDGIFMDATQETIYNKVKEGVLENVINGHHNAVIMAFGQTGSGKTFTISGLLKTEEEYGILPRITRDLFNLKNNEPENVKVCLQISYVEFYNTYAIDLLEDPPYKMDNPKCSNARKISVDSEIEASKCLFLGKY